MEVRELFGFDRQFYVWDHVTVALHLEEGQVPALCTELLLTSLPGRQSANDLLPPHLKCFISDHVLLQVLRFSPDQLRKNLTFCTSGCPPLRRRTFENLSEAENLVQELWPDHPGSLEEEMSLQHSFAGIKTSGTTP